MSLNLAPVEAAAGIASRRATPAELAVLRFRLLELFVALAQLGSVGAWDALLRSLVNSNDDDLHRAAHRLACTDVTFLNDVASLLTAMIEGPNA
jgi:hypothetical protein